MPNTPLRGAVAVAVYSRFACAVILDVAIETTSKPKSEGHHGGNRRPYFEEANRRRARTSARRESKQWLVSTLQHHAARASCKWQGRPGSTYCGGIYVIRCMIYRGHFPALRANEAKGTARKHWMTGPQSDCCAGRPGCVRARAWQLNAMGPLAPQSHSGRDRVGFGG